MELDNFKYNLSNLKKCNQIWDEMQPVLGGRLCTKCEKKITDFSEMTYSEIALFMAENKESVCGFYLPEQLPQITKKKSILPLTFGLSTLFTTSLIYGQTNTFIKAETNQTDKYKPIELSINSKRDNKERRDTIFIKGKIQSIDTTSNKIEPAEFVSIIIKGTKIGVVSNKSGEFILFFHPLEDSGTLSLLFKSVNYLAKQVDFEYKNKMEIDLGTITLLKDTNIIEYFVVIKKRTKFGKLWRKITKPFRRK